MRLLGGIAALGAVFAATAGHAADLRVKAPKPPPAPVASWTGFYLGAGVGFRSTEADLNLTALNAGPLDLFNNSCTNLAQFGARCTRGEPFNDTAFRFSPYLGFNWQMAPQWVIGVEGDVGIASKTTTLAGMLYPLPSGPITGRATDTLAIKTTWDASVRGRLGYLITPSVLAYVTGGGAWLHVETISNCGTTPGTGLPCTPDPNGFSPAVITYSQTLSGWTLGGGLEAALWPNWVARAEYRYADFGSFTVTDTRTRASGALSPFTATYDVKVKTHTALFGLAYKFGDPLITEQAASGYPLVTKAPRPAVASWSGFYLGAGAGVRSTRTAAAVTSFVVAGVEILPAACAGFNSIGGCVTSEPINDSAFRFSPYAGFNWQFAPQWLVGVEGDVGFANKSTTLSGMTYPLSGFMNGDALNSFSVKTTWDASARARFGYLVNPTVLIYATGGAAWLRVESTSTCNNDPNNGICAAATPTAITQATTKLGWTVGGGIEAILWQNWVARGEYRYADFGTITNTDTRTNPPIAGGSPRTLTYDLSVRSHTAMLGLAYKFDWGAPVVAKY
jgi:outer membrane immunogenic protein